MSDVFVPISWVSDVFYVFVMNRITHIVRDVPQHWVGDGFPVRSLFSYADGNQFDPFLLLDYAGPYEFAPGQAKRGVGEHPHRGFEAVTILYQGELEHRDSSGSHGVIGPGDVQWMTAASGIVHDEFHSQRFAEQGGVLEMIQLWVNLPASAKNAPPRYQSLLAADIPKVQLPNGAGSARVIADSRVLLLTGEPLDEPIFGQGPFVMNTRSEIRQAIQDYQAGKMGSLTLIRTKTHSKYAK